jgi:hypothetical protein
MNQLLLYFAKTILISGFLSGYYWVCLRNAPFHAYNRFYLLGITAISLILPFLHIPLPGCRTEPSILNGRNLVYERSAVAYCRGYSAMKKAYPQRRSLLHQGSPCLPRQQVPLLHQSVCLLQRHWFRQHPSKQFLPPQPSAPGFSYQPLLRGR